MTPNFGDGVTITPNFQCLGQTLLGSLILSQLDLVFTCREHQSFENSVGKGEIALNELFLFFPQGVFLPFLPFSSNLNFSSANSFNLEESTICHLGKG